MRLYAFSDYPDGWKIARKSLNKDLVRYTVVTRTRERISIEGFQDESKIISNIDFACTYVPSLALLTLARTC